MLSFEKDYNRGAHPEILRRFVETNMDMEVGYGNDSFCASAKEKIRAACSCPDADVFFLSGGTQTNAIVIDAYLAKYEGVVSAQTGHINVHESGAVEFTTTQEAKRQFDVNFFGVANACKYAIPMMKQKSKIVIIASATAIFPLPFKAYYCASKAAVDSFAQSLRMELSQTKIQVTSVCPGDVKTAACKL